MEKSAGSTTLAPDKFQTALHAAQSAVLTQDFIAAEHFFRQAVAQQNDSAIALAGLGQSLCQLNRPKDGIPFLYQAGKVLLRQAKQSGDSKYLLDLAYQLLHWHAPEEALMLVKAGLGINANSANAQHIAALCLQGLNKHSEACSFSRRAVELAPLDANALILLAVLEAKLGKLDDARKRLEFVVIEIGATNLARAHMELGVVLDKLGEFDLAFKHLREAGQITLHAPAATRIDKQAVYRDIGHYKSAFDAAFLRSGADRLPDDGLPSPVFLLGFFRSGTTLEH